MKLYRANYPTNSWDSMPYWQHSKKVAIEEATNLGETPESITVVTFYQYNHEENIRRLLNGSEAIGKEETLKGPTRLIYK
jgi:hypothetical protein